MVSFLYPYIGINTNYEEQNITPWCRACLDQLIVFHLVKKLLVFTESDCPFAYSQNLTIRSYSEVVQSSLNPHTLL
jgi:hypothetical protein